MLIDLTRNQIKTLIKHDPTFLDIFLDKIDAINPNPVEAQAIKFYKEDPKTWIRAIKKLRDWSIKNPHVCQAYGYEMSGGIGEYPSTLGLMAAKKLIEWAKENSSK